MSILRQGVSRKFWEGSIRMHVNPITLSFPPLLERQFSDEHFKSSRLFIRVSFIIGILMYSAFALLDRKVAPEVLTTLLKIRFLYICPIILITFLLSFCKWFKKYWQILIFLAIFLSGCGIIVMLLAGSDLVAQDYYVGLILVLIYGYFLIKLRYIYATYSGCLQLLLYFAIDYFYLDLPPQVSFANGFFLVSANLALIVGSYFIEYYTRSDFYARLLLDLERENVQRVNSELEKEVSRRTAELDSTNQELRHKIKELKLSQRELQESEEQLRLAFDASDASVWSLDLVSMKLLLTDVCHDILEYPAEQKVGHFDLDIIHQKDRTKFKLEIDKLLLKQTENTNIEFRLPSYSGSWKWLHAWGKISEYSPTNQPLIVMGPIFDITLRKENELELNNYRLNLEKSVRERTDSLESSQDALMYLMDDMNAASQKLKTVNKQLESVNKELESFSYSISHDLRAPLRGISGFTKILQDDYQDVLDDHGKEYLDLIKENSAMMSQLISDLLEFSRLGKQVIIPVAIDIPVLAKKIFATLTASIPERDIILETDEFPLIYADINLMNIVLTNLISNAVKFTVKCPKAVIRVGYSLEAGEHRICVQDNGVGFDMKYARKLFGVFQRMHSSEDYEGYGVGLSIVKRIITKHGGTTWAESEVDKGTSIFITLPRTEEEIELEEVNLQQD
ncbi:MAG: PAS domain S-box protein [Candidatus Cloacimonetes bacterium]|nr:PAS domain S-box protein [Candidatus Cloacimonadota bacterium]